MKKLFELTEEEKNRILGLHESATKNHYLINEQGVVVDNYKVAKTLGFGVDRTMSNNCQKVMILDGNGYYNLVSNVCPEGYIDFKIEADYQNTTITGNWVVSNQNVTITMSDGTKFTGTLTDGSVKTQVTNWLVKQPKFEEYVKKQMDPSIKDTWKSWGSGKVEVKSEDESTKWNNYPCVVNYPGVQQDKTPSGSVVYRINNEVYFNNGRKKLSDGTMKSYSCDDEIFKVQTKTETGGGSGSTVTQENPNVARIKELQRKVGVKDDGILGKQTLKAIMDKLTK